MTVTAGPVVVLAHWQTTEAGVAEVLACVADLRSQSLAEPGCLGYEALQGVADPSMLVLVERYRDGEALEAHRNSAHYRELVVERILPLLTDRRVEFLRPEGAP